MLSETIDAGTTSRRVGYQSVSEFSREYARFFGSAPMRDIIRLRKQRVDCSRRFTIPRSLVVQVASPVAEW
jgi:AraC-like DNA-binding protein